MPHPCLVNGALTTWISGREFGIEELKGFVAWDISNYAHTVAIATVNFTIDPSCSTFNGNLPCINEHSLDRTAGKWNETASTGLTGCPDSHCDKLPVLHENLGTFITNGAFGFKDVTSGVQNCFIDEAGIFSVRVNFLNGTDRNNGGTKFIAKQGTLTKAAILTLYHNSP